MSRPRTLPVALKGVRVSSPFGPRKNKNDPNHLGCDWATPVGLPLECTLDEGTVVLVGGSNTHGWGYHVHIQCKCPLKHQVEYHILRDDPRKRWKVGDEVELGDVIGHTGRSGSLAGVRYDPHHHHGTTELNARGKRVYLDPLTIGWPALATAHSQELDNSEEDDMYDEKAQQTLVDEIQQTRYLKLYVWGSGIIAVNPYGREWVLPNGDYRVLLDYLGLAPSRAIEINDAQHGFIIGLLRSFLPAKNFTDDQAKQVEAVVDLSPDAVANLVKQIGSPHLVLTESQVSAITAAAKSGAEQGVKALSFVTTVK